MTEECRQAEIRGGEKAWELARKIIFPSTKGGMQSWELYDCFKNESINDILLHLSYAEVLKRYTEWSKIEIGDEVKIMDFDELLMVVTLVGPDGQTIQGIDKDGECYEMVEVDRCRKTGRHFSEIKELLFKMNKQIK